ncbi:MAG: hypothetical protein ABI665_03850 [Vicinamibacterales bacterium]
MSRVITITDSLITAPANPPMTTAYAKKHIKAISTAEDALVDGWVLAATSYFEELTGRQIMTATREAWLDACPDSRGRIEIPKPPLQQIVSVAYVDASGTLQPSFGDGASPEVLSYAVKAPQGPHAARGWIEPVSGVQWPSTLAESGAVRIRYRCGYGDTPRSIDASTGALVAGSPPDLILSILCFLIGTFDQFRSAVHQQDRGTIAEVPYGVKMMIDGFKYSALPSIQMRTATWL